MNKINFNQKIKRLGKEFFSFQRYKASNKALGIIYFILTIPFFVVSVIHYALSILFNFIYELCASPISYLNGLLRKEGNEVKTPTQVVVYLIGFPTIFIGYCLLSSFTLLFFIIYALMNVTMFISSMGGTHFIPAITEDDTTRDEALNEPIPFKRLLATVITIGSLLLIGILLYAVGKDVAYYYYQYIGTFLEKPGDVQAYYNWSVVSKCGPIVLYVSQLLEIILPFCLFNKKIEK